jgi:hypothetical protein
VSLIEGIRWAHGRHLKTATGEPSHANSNPPPENHPPEHKPPEHKPPVVQRVIQQVQAPVYGNLRERCLKLSGELDNLSKYRNAKFEDRATYPRPLTRERVNEWLRSNNIRMEPFLPRIIALRDELAQMYFHDEILDSFLKKHQENLEIKRTHPEFDDNFVWLKVEDMDTVAECFRRLANQIPQ